MALAQEFVVNNVGLGSRNRGGRPRKNGQSEPAGLKALDRGLDVLEFLGENPGLCLSDLSDKLDLPLATLHRVLMTLQHRDFVSCDVQTMGWYVSSGVFRAGLPFVEQTLPVKSTAIALAKLRDRFDATAVLALPGADAAFVAQVEEARGPLRVSLPLGSSVPCHASAFGKAWTVAEGPYEDRAERDRENYTPHTIRSDGKLRADAIMSAERGYTIDAEEHFLGVQAVAAPVYGPWGDVVASMGLIGPVHHLSAVPVAILGAAVRDAARHISAALGHQNLE